MVLYIDIEVISRNNTFNFEELENRLRGRSTESEEKIQMRLKKAAEELSMSVEFDMVLLNDDLPIAIATAEAKILEFLNA